MINLKNLTQTFNKNDWQQDINNILPLIAPELLQKKQGDYKQWQMWLNDLPEITPSIVDCTPDCIIIGKQSDATEADFYKLMQQLLPWRKGPFNLFGVEIDAEWQSQLKWHRLANKINLQDCSVLDVGANNGYFSFKMMAAGASCVIGLDPQLKALVQFYALQKYAQIKHLHMLPLRLEEIAEPNMLANSFDYVFAMGTLYHARNPLEQLTQLKKRLVIGGTLVLETLILPEGNNRLITPTTTYLRMRNIWFVTTIDIIFIWLKRLGFTEIETLDITTTKVTEQRNTDWMPYATLADGLNPTDKSLTSENLPMPQRAIILAKRAN